MSFLVSDLLQTVQMELTGYSQLLLAYSGGVDSTVLLHLLWRLRQVQPTTLTVRAVYVHHGLSMNADKWAEHCQHQCQQWQIPLQVLHINVPKEKTSLEAAARDARYQALADYLQKDEVLLTAQHQDDQAETFLLALKRGSGPAGLASMPAKMPFAHSKQLRPLLSISRAAIVQYAQYNRLCWIDDESNEDLRFDRNFLRLTVLPQLNQRWSQFNALVARSAQLCAEQELLLDELLQPILTYCTTEYNSLKIKLLISMNDMKRAAILRRWLASYNVSMPSRHQLALIWQEVALAKQDADPKIVIADYQIRRYQDQLYILPDFSSLVDVVLDWDMQQPLYLPDNLGHLRVGEGNICVRAPNKDEHASIRFYAQGMFRIVGRQGSRKLKKIWQELYVPPWQRQRIPLLFYNNQLIAAINYFVTEQGAPNTNHCCSLQWQML